MEFIRKNYEKLILLVLGVLFLLVMLYALNIISKTKKITDEDLKIPTRRPDYETLRMKELVRLNEERAQANKETIEDTEENLAKIKIRDLDIDAKVMETSPDWQKSAARRPECASHYSDLVATFPMAECPHCKRIIPFYYFTEKNKCVECGKELKTPPERKRARIGLRTADDSDGDGMKNADEQKYGLNPNDSNDALQDKDGDGFSNVYEVECGTDPTKASDHPPLWQRLRFADVSRVELPLRFKSLNTNDSQDVKKWDVQLNVSRFNRRTGQMRTGTDILTIGDSTNVDNREYILREIKPDQKMVKEDGKEVLVDHSVIVLEEVVEADADGKKHEPDRLTVKVGEAAYSSDKRLVLEDIGPLPDLTTGARPNYKLRRGDEFALGTRATRVERFVLIDFNEESKTALVRHALVKDGEKPFVITAGSGIPSEMWVNTPVTENNADNSDDTIEIAN